MKILTHTDIIHLNIPPLECVNWARTVIRNKNQYVLPPKISLKPAHDVFYNTMPCIIPDLGRFGVKIVSRYPQRIPSLDSQIMIYDLASGSPLALLDGNWITAMRTGAVATVAVESLARRDFSVVGLIGLGNVTRAVMECLSAAFPEKPLRYILRRYKDQAELLCERFKNRPNIRFEIVDCNQSLIENSHVIISSPTATDELLGKDEWYPEGVLVVPVHTRGFQNCDLFFDKVFSDDTGHVQGFKYFDRFRQHAELTDVLTGVRAGRESSRERILSYNIGIAIQDVYFSSKIIERAKSGRELSLLPPQNKFWA